MNWAAPHLATRSVLGWVVQSGRFFRGWNKKVLTKEKTVVIKEKLDSPTGKREEKGTGKVLSSRLPLLQLGMGELMERDCLIA